MKSEHDSFLAYYLTQDDPSALNFKDVRSTLAPYQVRENQEVSPWGIIRYHIPTTPQETVFQFVRDYETVKVEQEVPNEFLLVLHDGDGPDNGFVNGHDKPSTPRQKGAYYKNIERKMLLKKKRANVRTSSRFSCS